MHLRGNQPLAFAGVWDRGSGDGKTIESTTITVTDTVEVLRSDHDRMPVILRPDGIRPWLDAGEQNPAHLKALLQPYAAPELEAYRVSMRANNARTDAPDLIAPKPGD
jgi:putative SOS response-associated peptidase YedK